MDVARKRWLEANEGRAPRWFSGYAVEFTQLCDSLADCFRETALECAHGLDVVKQDFATICDFDAQFFAPRCISGKFDSFFDEHIIGACHEFWQLHASHDAAR